MLILTRKPGEAVRIGDQIRIVVLERARSGETVLGIDAPRDVPIAREELLAGVPPAPPSPPLTREQIEEGRRALARGLFLDDDPPSSRYTRPDLGPEELLARNVWDTGEATRRSDP